MKKILQKSLSFILALAMVMSVMTVVTFETKAADLDYSLVFDAAFYSAKYADVNKAYGNDSEKLFNHFIKSGMKEGRQGCADFDVIVYKNKYADLQAVYGDNLKLYFLHYLTVGNAEGRTGKPEAKAVASDIKVSTSENLPANAIAHGNGYFLPGVGQAVMEGINVDRAEKGKRELTWSYEICNSTTNRAKEIMTVFGSGRPDGSSWETAYSGFNGGIKEMIYKENGVATAASILSAIRSSSDRSNYVMTPYFEKCGAAVYTENGVSYVVISFSQNMTEKNEIK